MKQNRRQWLQTAGAGLGMLTWAGPSARSAEPEIFAKPSRMKVGLVTYNLAKDMDIETIIKTCEAAQIQGVELRTTHAHGVEVSLNQEQRAAVKKRFQDSAVELMGLGSAFDYHTPDQDKLRKDIEATKEYIRLARDVGASGVKVRPNGFPEGVPQEKTLEQIGKSLREIGEFGQDYGIQIRLEVHGNRTSELPHIKTMMDVADHKNVGVCWNSNATDLAGEDFDSNFNLVKDKIFSCHVNDLFNERYPYRRLLTRLNEIGFQGYCLAELPHTSPDPVMVLKYFRALWLAYQNLL
ncbi:MAG: sugar phosphate isomerase/epimerase family protein [bacterium]